MSLKKTQQKNSPGPHTPPRCLPLMSFTLKQTPPQVTLLCCLHFPTSYVPKAGSPLFLPHLSEQSLMTSHFYIKWALQSLLLRNPLLHPALLSSPLLTALPSLGFCGSFPFRFSSYLSGFLSPNSVSPLSPLNSRVSQDPFRSHPFLSPYMTLPLPLALSAICTVGIG